MNYTEMTVAALSAMLTAIQGNDLLTDQVDAILAEQDRRIAEAIKAEESQGLRDQADKAAMFLSDIAHSKVAEVAATDGPAYKGAARMLAGLIMSAYDLTDLKARKAVTVLLSGEKGHTDVKDVAGAVAYVQAHKSSTAFNQS
jgi:hypothetical protein